MRDRTAPEKRVRAAVESLDETSRAKMAKGELDQATVGYQLAVAQGLYTLGANARTCLEPANRIVDHYCDWAARAGGPLRWHMSAQLHNEFVGAAVLAGKADRLFSVFETVRWAVSPPDWERADMDLVCQAFGGRAPEPDRVPAELPKSPPWLPPLAALMTVVARVDQQQFAEALATYLLKSWGPAAEKDAKAALASHWPLYTGKWSLLAAAACRKMGEVPPLPTKAEPYLPRDLV